MAKKLKDLNVLEISLVPKGANQKTYAIVKSEDGKEIMISKELLHSLSKTLTNETEISALLEKENLPQSASESLLGAIRLLANAELPENSRGEVLTKLLKLTIGEKEMSDKKEDKTQETPVSKTDDKALENVTKEFQGKIAELTKALEGSNTRVKEMAEQLEKERSELKEKEFVAKAEGYKHLGADKAKLAKALRAVSEKCPEACAELEKVLSAANTAIEKGGLFDEKGSSQTGGANDVLSQIEKIAKDIVEKEKVSPAKAEALAWERNPELYTKAKNGGK